MCNQSGSIGHHDDYSINNWSWEVLCGYALTDCKYNIYKLGINVTPLELHNEGIMYIFIKRKK